MSRMRNGFLLSAAEATGPPSANTSPSANNDVERKSRADLTVHEEMLWNMAASLAKSVQSGQCRLRSERLTGASPNQFRAYSRLDESEGFCCSRLIPDSIPQRSSAWGLVLH